jgi:hypothetical protein
MRTCGCSGSTWPYSLRVCDMCIKDDATSLTGRIRHCGICWVVACDEDCGVELVECTDAESWNNAGELLPLLNGGMPCLCRMHCKFACESYIICARGACVHFVRWISTVGEETPCGRFCR